jgi:hypothetical protein
MREKVRRRQYVMTLHADEEMDDDGLSIFDVESAILTGAIIERQRDRKTRGSKYLVRGQTVDGAQIIVAVTKFGRTGKLVILTVYVE